jgi:uncharacterized protein YbaP (TraB family)
MNCKSEDNGLLWKISGNGLEQPSYLLGTFHILSYTFLDSIPGLYEAFKTANQFVCETNSSSLDKSKYLSDIMMPKDTTYKDLLSAEDLLLLDSVLVRYFKVNSEQMNISPFYLTVFITMGSIEGLQVYRNPENLMDIYLNKVATENKYTVIELDEEDLMSRILSPYSLKKQADGLMSYIKYPIMREIQEKMKVAYLQQDLIRTTQIYNHLKEVLNAMNVNELDSTQPMDDYFLDGRNKIWMEKLPSIIQKAPSFIAVGALHLVRESGLINQLQKMGYTVEPVK